MRKTHVPRWQQMLPASSRQAYFFPKAIRINWQDIRREGKRKLSEKAQLKLEWIIFYHTQAEKNAKQTAAHFGISRKTVHKWLKRFREGRLSALEEESRTPFSLRKRQITLQQRVRVKSLRTVYPKHGKMKLVFLYKKQYGDKISSWKIQKIIQEGNLYYDKVRASRLRRKQVQARIHQRQRITKLVKENKVNFLWHVDTVILTLAGGGYRYLLTELLMRYQRWHLPDSIQPILQEIPETS